MDVYCKVLVTLPNVGKFHNKMLEKKGWKQGWKSMWHSDT